MTVPRDPELSAIGSSSETLRQQRQMDAENAPGVVLALGGGFSRGFAHLGVIEVLEQEHIPIAGIVGTSIGSLLGAAFADGIAIRELCDLGRRVRIRDFLRFRKSQPEAQKNDRIGQFVREWFHSTRIEELSIPTSIVTTDVDTCAPYVFSRGPLDVAIRASCAFPGLFEPVEYEGRTLADGCIAAPVPTVTAARMNAGCVLGVAVNSGVGTAAFAGGAAQGSKGTLAITRGAKPSPSWIRNADVMLEPDVQQIGWSDFSRVDEAHAAGAEAMRAALPYLRDLLSRARERMSAAERFRHLESRMAS
jgi:NTE family protein